MTNPMLYPRTIRDVTNITRAEADRSVILFMIDDQGNQVVLRLQDKAASKLRDELEREAREAP
jgi:hypothetical protein